MFESIIKDAIVDHLVKFNLIGTTQHGFRSGSSCLTNLLLFLESVTGLLDEDLPVDTVYLDFSKAFDKVPHARLIRKLKSHGITGHVSKWIESWLTGRQQRVIINGYESEWKPVISGVPQGSVLGPTLFLIYINDIDDNIDGDVLKFADDTKLWRMMASPVDAMMLQEDLYKLSDWSTEWQMLFNPGKCKCLHVGHKNMHYDYFIGDTCITSVEEEKDSGVLINDSLSSSQ